MRASADLPSIQPRTQVKSGSLNRPSLTMGGSPPGGSLLPYPRRPDLAETGLQGYAGYAAKV